MALTSPTPLHAAPAGQVRHSWALPLREKKQDRTPRTHPLQHGGRRATRRERHTFSRGRRLAPLGVCVLCGRTGHAFTEYTWATAGVLPRLCTASGH